MALLNRRGRRVYVLTEQGEERLKRIKSLMLPYLDSTAEAIDRLRSELYR